jgi:hypothetical protein
MTTIAYDKPVKDYIAQLSATGHVTHRSYRKTSVTLHHNGGRLSHEGVLNVWKTRPASAHFDVDGGGAVCQYVNVNEYAWAVGNTAGNQSSISIEMANATTAPGWTVADATWRSAARLAGWLFAKVIGARPSSGNLFYHHKWSSTACAGPYMDSIYNQVLAAAQAAYDAFVGAKPAPAPSPKPAPAPKPSSGTPTVQGNQGNVYLGKLRRGQTDSDSVRVYQRALRNYPGISTIPLNPNGATGNYGSETEAMTRLMYTTLDKRFPGQGWGSGDLGVPGRSLLRILGCNIVG